MQGTFLTQYSSDELKAIIKEAIAETLPPPSEKLYSTKEFADELDVTTVTVHNWKKSGRVDCLRVGNALRFKQSELDRLIREVPRLSNP